MRPDVFADILNVLLFDGKQVVQSEELFNVGMRSQFKAGTGREHEQERDVAKYWIRDGKILAMFGVFPLRVCLASRMSCKNICKIIACMYSRLYTCKTPGERIMGCNISKAWMDLGRKEGIKETSKEMNLFITYMLRDNRVEELKRSASDSTFQEKLFEEYGLSK